MRKISKLLWLPVLLAAMQLVAASSVVASASGSAKAGKPVYVQIDAITSPVVRDGRIVGKSVIGVDLATTTGPAQLKLLHALPRVRDRFRALLLRTSAPDARGRIALSYIKNGLQNILDQVVGTGTATVLFRDAFYSKTK